MTTINGCLMNASRLVRSRWHEAHGYLLHSFPAAIKRSIKLDPSLFTNFSNAHESRRHLTPPLSVRPSLMPPPPPPSFMVAAGNHAAAAKSFLRVRLPLIGLHTDRPTEHERERRCVDASIRLGDLQRMIRITAGIKRQFVLDLLFEEDTLHACYQNFLDSSFKFKTR